MATDKMLSLEEDLDDILNAFDFMEEDRNARLELFYSLLAVVIFN